MRSPSCARSSPMSDRKLPDDRELEEFLSGKSELSRKYHEVSPHEGTTPEMDDLVLRRAQQGIELQRRARRRAFIVPLSLAASVVVMFSVVVMMRQQTGGLPPPTPTV